MPFVVWEEKPGTCKLMVDLWLEAMNTAAITSVDLWRVSYRELTPLPWLKG